MIEEKNIQKENQFTKIINMIKSNGSILTFIISFLLPILTFKGAGLPISIAWIGALSITGVPIVINFVLALASTFIFTGLNQGIIFILASVSLIFIIAFLKSRGYDNKKEYKYIFITMLISFISYVLVNVLFNSFDLVKSIIYLLISGIFLKIFINTTEFAEDYKYKEFFSIEEIISFGVIIVLISNIFSGFNFVGITFSNIPVFLLILILTWKNNTVIGIVSSILFGSLNFVLQASEPGYILICLFIGIITGILSRKKKNIVVSVITISSLILFFITKNSLFIESSIAALFLIFIPKKLEANIDGIFNNKNYFESFEVKELNKSEVEIEEDNIVLEEQEEFEKFAFKVFDKIKEYEESILYQEIIDLDNNIMRNIYDELTKNERYTIEMLLELLLVRNTIIIDIEVSKSDVRKKAEEILQYINDIYILENMKIEKKEKEKEIKQEIEDEKNKQ